MNVCIFFMLNKCFVSENGVFSTLTLPTFFFFWWFLGHVFIVFVSANLKTLNNTITSKYTEADNGGVLGNSCFYLPADKIFSVCKDIIF